MIFVVSLFSVVIVVLPWGIIRPAALDGASDFAFDTFQRISPRLYDPNIPVRVVAVDEESLSSYGQWPWPRQKLAELTMRLQSMGASAIIYDFIFAEPDRSSLKSMAASLADSRIRARIGALMANSPDGDDEFRRAIEQSSVVLGNVVSAHGGGAQQPKAGFVIVGDNPDSFLSSFPATINPISRLSDVSSGVGATNWLPDNDRVVRHVPLVLRSGTNYAPSLALEALRVALGASTYVIRSSNSSGETAFGQQTGVNAIKIGDIEIPTGSATDIRPRYSISNAARTFSAKSIFDGKVPQSEIEGRIIFVGASAAGLGDTNATPLDAAVPGVEIHAQIAESLLSGSLLTHPDWAPGLELSLAVAGCVLTLILFFFASGLFAAAFAPLLIIAFIVSSFSLYAKSGILIDPVYPSGVVLVSYLVGAVTLWRAEAAARNHVRHAFGKFVSPAVVSRLAEKPELLVLGGETRHLSVLFCDMRHFSAISEGLSAADLTKFMNEYFAPMTEAILSCEGTIDKYIGDAILAFWNAPLEIEGHERKAVDAALRMRQALEKLNSLRRNRGLEEIAFGIGLHAGMCSVGNMGCSLRFDYSILGDTVNLASRIEGATKALSVDILCTETIRSAAPAMAWLDLGLVQVAGRSGAAHIFALAGDEQEAQSSAFRETCAAHDRMMGFYYQGDFQRAAQIAVEAAQDASLQWQSMYLKLAHRFTTLSHGDELKGDKQIWRLSGK